MVPIDFDIVQKQFQNKHQALNSGKCNFLLLSCKIDKHTELFHF